VCICASDADAGVVPAFVTALIDPAGYAVIYPGCDLMRADLTNDGLADGRDIALFVTAMLAGPCPG
jgi:hypothetical protein